jgi:hypothetical protein
MTLILEPLATEYEIPPGENVRIVGEFLGAPEYGELEFLPDNHVAVYVAPDAIVMRDQAILKPSR